MAGGFAPAFKPVVELVKGAGDDFAGGWIEDQAATDALKEVPPAFILCFVGVVEDEEAIFVADGYFAELFPIGEAGGDEALEVGEGGDFSEWWHGVNG